MDQRTYTGASTFEHADRHIATYATDIEQPRQQTRQTDTEQPRQQTQQTDI